jgi:hypothetical protein
MATDIVGSLFGVNPQAYQQVQQNRAYNQDYQAVQLDPLQQANLALRQGGRGLGQVAGGLLGMQDPELAKASMAKQLASQFDITSPAGLRQYAQALAQNGAPDLAQMASAEADKREQSGLGLQKTRADIAISERKVSQDEKLREALAALPTNATDEQYLQVFRQFGSPDQQARAIEAAMARRAKGAGDGVGGVGAPGPVGKSGAYRDITGQILGPTEMKTVRSEFETNQRLLSTLNNVTASDVKDAESFVDWTTKGESKALASKATLNAQSKIAASQLLEQIGQLPPGSASDADMRAAMKSFPGYSDPEALAQWVNRTKEKLLVNIGRTSDQFGFKPTVKPTEPIDLTKKASKPGSSRDNPIKLD